MRALFLHTAVSGLSAEYKVHMTLATHAMQRGFEPYFIWQTPIATNNAVSNRIIPYDFGRDITLNPLPKRLERGGMVIQKLPQALAFLNSRIRQIKPDLLYTSQQSFDVRLAGFLSGYFRIPHVIHIHYNVGPWLGKYTFNAIRQSSLLIAVSEYTRQTALLQGVSSSAIHTVINPAPMHQAQPQQNARTIRAEFNFAEDTPIIVAVGRLDPGKGHLALFEAFAQVIRSVPNARLLVCGAATFRDGFEDLLRQRVNELHLQQHIIFTGQRSDIPAIMRSANVFCLPTELDSCPLVFLEAMGEGLPVVAYYSGGVPEMVLHNQTGLLSYPGDVQTLAANLQTVLADNRFARQLGAAGKARVEQAFTPIKAANRWLDILERQVHHRRSQYTSAPQIAEATDIAKDVASGSVV